MKLERGGRYRIHGKKYIPVSCSYNDISDVVYFQEFIVENGAVSAIFISEETEKFRVIGLEHIEKIELELREGDELYMESNQTTYKAVKPRVDD